MFTPVSRGNIFTFTGAGDACSGSTGEIVRKLSKTEKADTIITAPRQIKVIRLGCNRCTRRSISAANVETMQQQKESTTCLRGRTKCTENLLLMMPPMCVFCYSESSNRLRLSSTEVIATARQKRSFISLGYSYKILVFDSGRGLHLCWLISFLNIYKAFYLFVGLIALTNYLNVKP